MATSSRQTAIFGVNDWKSIYKTYRQADLQSYDYETLRKTFVDYLRTYYPETFNDYVESSEYVALLDVIAFMGQGLAFRDDLNARENFIDTAERRDSVIKLANLVGYTPKRNLAAQGYLKISSIQTTEQVKDVNGLNLSNVLILWNDPANPNWQEQFNSIVNAALISSQRVGRPGNSNTILGVKTEEYTIQRPRGTLPTASFSGIVQGTNMNFECVSVTSLNSDNIYETGPNLNSNFTIVYRNDKLGYGSVDTGFFVYFKQGVLKTFNFNITEQLSNQLVDIDIQGINNSDTWLYKIDPITGTETVWTQVENIYDNTRNVQNANNKQIFSVTSRFNDQVSYTFGDGVFGKIPNGNFRAYVRSSNALTYTINPDELQGTAISLTYVGKTGRTETLSMTLELMTPVNNGQGRESLANIKQRAPQRYYSQNRMVNGEDYNNFPFTLYNSIIKSKALNRSSVGVSRNFDLLDPTGKYSSTNLFAEDGGLYLDDTDGTLVFNANSTNDILMFLTDTISNELNSHKVFQYYSQHFTRYKTDISSGDGEILWKQSSFNELESTGYFYNAYGPVSIGVYTTGNTKYLTPSALLKFKAPDGFYFNKENKLVAGIPGVADNIYLWTSISNIVGEGSNNGEGNLITGYGPVTLNNALQTGLILKEVLPSFTNSFPTTLIQDVTNQVLLGQNFTLVFRNDLLANQDRWLLSTFTDSRYFVKFESLGNGRYKANYKAISYYFASSSSVRFTFTKNQIIYDPATGKLLQDYINILKVNSYPDSNYPFPNDTKLSVVGQLTEADGYVDDYCVEVASTDPNTSGSIKNPDFFYLTTGYATGATNWFKYVFFELITDSSLLSRYQMVETNAIISAYTTKQEIALVRYEYSPNTVFFAGKEKTFYKTVQSTYSKNVIELVQVDNYIAKIGRQGLAFQYKHISGNTTRIDPATTNIIDLYIVTQSYYTQYQNWIKDSTGKISEPEKPTLNELNLVYSKMNDYKMLTDSLILNSVIFKPLFGNKAEPKLRATIKIIKSSLTTASDSEIRSAVLTTMNSYFQIENWNFGDTFYFSELSAYVHSIIGDLVSSIVLVPNDPSMKFGDLYEIHSSPYEIFVNATQATDIMVISSLSPSELQIV